MGNRGERVTIEDRAHYMELIQEAVISGARIAVSCNLLKVSVRTIERWKQNPDKGDGRAGPVTVPTHTLTNEERQKMIAIANSPPYKDLTPWKIVAKQADLGCYIASESSYYRVLKKENLLSHREKSKPRIVQPPKDLIAIKPNEVWSWDITYLKTTLKGSYYYLYLMMDVFSRFIVGWSVEDVESMELSSKLVTRACKAESIEKETLTIHADNGGPMKGATMLVTLEKLCVLPSFSRPSVSDDNPFSEALFKTLKYCPGFPEKPFESIDAARVWVETFVQWYNNEHLHSGIKFVTPQSRHAGDDKMILEKRHAVYVAAKATNPHRWTGKTRNWARITTVRLNPGKETKNQLLRNQAA